MFYCSFLGQDFWVKLYFNDFKSVRRLVLIPNLISSFVRKLCGLFLGGRLRWGTCEREAPGDPPDLCSEPSTHPALRQERQKQRQGGAAQEDQERPISLFAAAPSSTSSTCKPQERLRLAPLLLLHSATFL